MSVQQTIIKGDYNVRRKGVKYMAVLDLDIAYKHETGGSTYISRPNGFLGNY